MVEFHIVRKGLYETRFPGQSALRISVSSAGATAIVIVIFATGGFLEMSGLYSQTASSTPTTPAKSSSYSFSSTSSQRSSHSQSSYPSSQTTSLGTSTTSMPSTTASLLSGSTSSSYA